MARPRCRKVEITCKNRAIPTEIRSGATGEGFSKIPAAEATLEDPGGIFTGTETILIIINLKNMTTTTRSEIFRKDKSKNVRCASEKKRITRYKAPPSLVPFQRAILVRPVS